jgi:hypothetical protein
VSAPLTRSLIAWLTAPAGNATVRRLAELDRYAPTPFPSTHSGGVSSPTHGMGTTHINHGTHGSHFFAPYRRGVMHVPSIASGGYCVALTVRTRGRLPGHAQPSLCAAQSAAMVVTEIRNQTLARTRRRMKDLETTPGVVIQGGRASADFGRLLPQSSSASRLTAGASGFELKPIRRAVGD